MSNKAQWIKIGKGALIAIGGALVAYIPVVVETVDWGQWLPLVGALASILINIIRVTLQQASQGEITGYSIEQ